MFMAPSRKRQGWCVVLACRREAPDVDRHDDGCGAAYRRRRRLHWRASCCNVPGGLVGHHDRVEAAAVAVAAASAAAQE